MKSRLFLVFVLLLLTPSCERSTPTEPFAGSGETQDFFFPALVANEAAASMIVFARGYSDLKEGAGLWVMNEDGSFPRPITGAPGLDYEPAWAPDGTMIVFTSYRDGNEELYLTDVDGSNQTRLTNDPAWDYDPAWAPDGSRIVFTRGEPPAANIFTIAPDGSGLKALTTDGMSTDPHWSPDGSKVVLRRVTELKCLPTGVCAVGGSEILVLHADGTNPIFLTDTDDAREEDPVWSPDGGKIAYSRDRDIWVMNADGSGQMPVVQGPDLDASPEWSPDGSQIAYSRFSKESSEIYVSWATGGGDRPLTNDPTFRSTEPSWGGVPFHCSLQSQMPLSQCTLLVDFYEDTGGEGWADNTGWLKTMEPCGWHGVTCEISGLVERLELGNNNLVGPIPPELGSFSALTYLGLFGNPLTGSIPPELGGLSLLESLALHENQLTGPIPPELGDLPFLESLYLFENQLSGPIPPELGGLPSLTDLFLHSNQLSGLVPLEVAERGGLLDGHCLFAPPGNEDLYMPATDDYLTADADGDGFICGMELVEDSDPVIDDAVEEIEELEETETINHGAATSLTVFLDRAEEQAANGRYKQAIKLLDQFVAKLDDLVSQGEITPEDAQPLLAGVEILRQLWTGG